MNNDLYDQAMNAYSEVLDAYRAMRKGKLAEIFDSKQTDYDVYRGIIDTLGAGYRLLSRAVIEEIVLFVEAESLSTSWLDSWMKNSVAIMKLARSSENQLRISDGPTAIIGHECGASSQAGEGGSGKDSTSSDGLEKGSSAHVASAGNSEGVRDSMKDTKQGVEGLESVMYEMFSTYRLTGERQHLLAGLFKWLRDNKFDPMSPGEVKMAIRMGFPEVLAEEPRL